jgi:CBS domain-containing protein
MSPRAAWQLEHLGFGPVYDYVSGKVDWMAAGLSTTRADASERRALDVADRVAVTCSPTMPVADLPARQSVIVVNGAGIVLGRVGPRPGEERYGTVEEIMRPGPTTVRANEPLDPLLERMRARGVTEMIVTTPEGRLLGVVRRA